MAKKINFGAINAFALARFSVLLTDWLPDGKRQGNEWCARNPTRADDKRGSFSVNVATGVWEDFATGDSGGDPISLYAYLYHNGRQGDAAKALQQHFGLADDIKNNPESAKKPKSSWRPIAPPFGVVEPPRAHSVRGLPEMTWSYKNHDGCLLGYVYRFKTSDGGKEVLPLSWCVNDETGASEWRWMAFAEPRWLYGLDRLAAKPEATVLVVEGEKCADVAHEQLANFAVVSWPGGGKAVDKCGWDVLAGRTVVVWPDCDSKREKIRNAERDAGVDPKAKPFLPADKQPGAMAGRRIADILLGMGCRVFMVNIPEPGEVEDGRDVADFVADGIVGDELLRFLRTNVRELVQSSGANDAPPQSAGAGDGHCSVQADWDRGLLKNANGGNKDCRENVFLIVSRHPAWDGVIAWNDFTRRVEKLKKTPFDSVGMEWNASDDRKLGLWLAQNCWLTLKSEQTIKAGVEMVAERNSFHPPRDWLLGLPLWDGVSRLSSFLSDCIGCDNSVYSQLVGTFFMTGLVARLFVPGCKMDYMPVLEGKQGLGKSTFWRALVGVDWFQETPFKIGNADAYMVLDGTWLYEIAEMDAFNKAEITAMKAFISAQKDKFREPYATRPIERLRQCVFAGTTNHGEYLKDTTGNRRIWPLRARFIDLELLESYRVMLFAEALHRFRSGERWHPTGEEEREHFMPEQDERRVVDPWLYPLQDWLDDVSQLCSTEFTVTDILRGAFLVEVQKIDGNRSMATRVGNLMAEIDGGRWIRKRRSIGRREWVYVRPEEDRLKKDA